TGLTKGIDSLNMTYPDSIFIQVNDVLINLDDIPLYLFELKTSHHEPMTNINIHASKEVDFNFINKVLNQINPEGIKTSEVHFVLKSNQGDIGLIKANNIVPQYVKNQLGLD
ncbi:MAG: hypothetical protein AAGI07_02950, partial [Bacteroidota bacterium]